MRARRDLVGHRVALANQLRAHLAVVFPAAVGLFAEIDSPISLKFLTRFNCQQRADWLTEKRLAAWLKSVGYCGRTSPAVLITQLNDAPRGAIGDHGTARTHTTHAMLAVLNSLVEQIKALEAQIAEQLALHADAHIFQSCPRKAPSALPGCSPRSATPAAGSPTPHRWPAWPVSHPPPASPADTTP